MRFFMEPTRASGATRTSKCHKVRRREPSKAALGGRMQNPKLIEKTSAAHTQLISTRVSFFAIFLQRKCASGARGAKVLPLLLWANARRSDHPPTRPRRMSSLDLQKCAASSPAMIRPFFAKLLCWHRLFPRSRHN